MNNLTPFLADRTVCQDRHGRDRLVVILKATYRLDRGGQGVPDEEQQPVVVSDDYHGEPVTSSIHLEGELIPPKPSTDVVMVGHAHAPGERASTKVDVGIQVGPLSKIIRVFGDRFWDLGVLRNKISPPLPFEKMPLIYERAYGGEDHESEESRRKREPRNPVGRGFFWPGNPAKTWPLPNLEDPKALISSLRDRPQPACFGFVSRHWKPRVDFIGTYDEAWRDSRFPLLPVDFDERHYNAAHPDLIAPSHLRGDEPVEAHNVTPSENPWTFRLPGYQPQAEVSVGNQHEAVPLFFDTLLLQPESERFVMVWRGSLDIHDRLLKITNIKIQGS